MKRRYFLSTLPALAAAAATSAAPSATPGITKSEILFGQTADLSASRSAITKAYSEGARLYFENVNNQGGINGRKIRLIQMDDAYQTPRAVENAKVLVEQEKVFALMHSVGTGIIEKLIPYVEQQGIPHVHALTGADQVRPPALMSTQTFFLRASYRREVEKIVIQLKTLGITSIALIIEDEPFGQGIRSQAQAIMQENGLSLAAIGVMPFNKPSEFGPAVAAMKKAQPAAIIVGSAGAAVESFIQGCFEAGLRSQFYCLSVCNVERVAKTLGKRSEGIVVSQVMPAVRRSNLPVVVEYRKALAAHDAAGSSFGLEGYLSGRIIVDALRAAGPNLTRSRLVEALLQPASSQIGGFPVTYRGDARNGSPFVELAMIGRDGKLLQ